MLQTVAALYVDPKGVYANLPGVEVWDEARDARLYAGPHLVVAHPPCAAWCRWSMLRERDGYGRRGDDDGMFAAAYAAVRAFGGVLEHPAHSLAWSHFGIPEPLSSDWHMTTAGWVAVIDQAEWGLRAHKPTWLLYVGDAPVPLTPTHDASHAKRGAKELHSGHRHLTPITLAEQLLAMCRTRELTG